MPKVGSFLVVKSVAAAARHHQTSTLPFYNAMLRCTAPGGHQEHALSPIFHNSMLRCAVLLQVTIKNMRFLNGASNGLPGGMISVWGAIDITFINCEFGGAIGGCISCICSISMVSKRHRTPKIHNVSSRSPSQVGFAACSLLCTNSRNFALLSAAKLLSLARPAFPGQHPLAFFSPSPRPYQHTHTYTHSLFAPEQAAMVAR